MYSVFTLMIPQYTENCMLRCARCKAWANSKNDKLLEKRDGANK
jgi:hypothetical protein